MSVPALNESEFLVVMASVFRDSNSISSVAIFGIVLLLFNTFAATKALNCVLEFVAIISCVVC